MTGENKARIGLASALVMALGVGACTSAAAPWTRWPPREISTASLVGAGMPAQLARRPLTVRLLTLADGDKLSYEITVRVGAAAKATSVSLAPVQLPWRVAPRPPLASVLAARGGGVPATEADAVRGCDLAIRFFGQSGRRVAADVIDFDSGGGTLSASSGAEYPLVSTGVVAAWHMAADCRPVPASPKADWP